MTKKLQSTVSVIIPTYNRGNFIEAAISSILDQSYECFELIVVDDGSTDDTAEIVSAINDSRLVYLRQENQGRSSARNRALRIAKGDYIAFLDSDDEYLQDKLATQVAYLNDRREIGMVYTSAICVDEFGSVIANHAYTATASGNIYEEVAFFRPLTITLPTVMLRREVIDIVGFFDERMERFEDTDYWRRVAKRFKVGAIDVATCKLRTHSSNSLKSQNPNVIAESIDYYVTKIFLEDADVGTKFLSRGASGLYEYYGRAFITVPAWRARGVALLRRAVSVCPNRGPRVIIFGVVSMLRSLFLEFVSFVSSVHKS